MLLQMQQKAEIQYRSRNIKEERRDQSYVLCRPTSLTKSSAFGNAEYAIVALLRRRLQLTMRLTLIIGASEPSSKPLLTACASNTVLTMTQPHLPQRLVIPLSVSSSDQLVSSFRSSSGSSRVMEDPTPASACARGDARTAFQWIRRSPKKSASQF
ncbi:hypothetical protein BCV70DRAFT_27735 [Testicularia cyperi]|uniref:Uncharacterized protein n=1 Tax=Testicularia cyperi TaxID=1882483 RepID=A0A317XN96_9BASI|nr:hypothetical protein BCV70DRAFT_27735 [Testicularia cyperi]